MSLLAAPIVKNSYILARIYFVFLKIDLKIIDSLLIPNSDITKKIEKAVTK